MARPTSCSSASTVVAAIACRLSVRCLRSCVCIARTHPSAESQLAAAAPSAPAARQTPRNSSIAARRALDHWTWRSLWRATSCTVRCQVVQGIGRPGMERCLGGLQEHECRDGRHGGIAGSAEVRLGHLGDRCPSLGQPGRGQPFVGVVGDAGPHEGGQPGCAGPRAVTIDRGDSFLRVVSRLNPPGLRRRRGGTGLLDSGLEFLETPPEAEQWFQELLQVASKLHLTLHGGVAERRPVTGECRAPRRRGGVDTSRRAVLRDASHLPL